MLFKDFQAVLIPDFSQLEKILQKNCVGTKRILQDAFFSKVNLPVADDSEIIQSLETTPEMCAEAIIECQTALNNLQPLAAAYMKQLLADDDAFEKTLREVADKAVEGDSAAKAEYQRVKTLQTACHWRMSLLTDIQKALAQIERANEKNLDAARGREFALRLRQARQASKLTQAELALRLHISQTGYASYEQGKNQPSITTMIRICEILQVSADKLLGLS